MIVGIVLSAISGGATALAVSLAHDVSALHAVLSYPLGGIVAVMAFATVAFGRQSMDRY
ncbi:hypothetical protein [Cypionkella sinensis]|uniref:Uncharacterized protein n=1 Tax=Cypionkella sinensis TaxID=1756043 RepID=A0ABV7J264_9RHOB